MKMDSIMSWGYYCDKCEYNTNIICYIGRYYTIVSSCDENNTAHYGPLCISKTMQCKILKKTYIIHSFQERVNFKLIFPIARAVEILLSRVE